MMMMTIIIIIFLKCGSFRTLVKKYWALPSIPCSLEFRAALHLETLLGWRLASTTHYNKIITEANFPIWKGLRAKKSR